MAETLAVLRVLRAAHRKRGGSSTLTRAGARLMLAFEGPDDAVRHMEALVAGMRRQLERVVACRAFADRLEEAIRAER